jgi:hypothetical protein
LLEEVREISTIAFLVLHKLIGYGGCSIDETESIIDESHRFAVRDSVALVHAENSFNNIEGISA